MIKKIIKISTLRVLFFIPDLLMIHLQYLIKTKRLLNLRKPERYTEKIQKYKLSYRKEIIRQCSDKLLVREYVSSKGLEDFLIPLLQVQDNIFSIDFDNLPSSYIIKSNSASGANIKVENERVQRYAIIVRYILASYLSYEKSGREWGYYNTKKKVYVEKLLDRNSNGDIPDFKFFCFDGKVECLYVMQDYVDDHSRGQCSFFDRSFNRLSVTRSEYKPISQEVGKPRNFDKMVEIAELLSNGFPHVRVDLYNVEGMIYFGEMTFYPASGYSMFDPDQFDLDLGQKFVLQGRAYDQYFSTECWK